MKRIFIIGILLAFAACRNQEKEEQIRLGDYNQPDSTETGMMPQGPDISADSVLVDSTKKALDSVKVDRTKISPQSKMEDLE